MPNSIVVMQDPDTWAPLVGIVVRAIDADTGDILDTQETGTDGYATFDTTDLGDRYYFKAEVTRTRSHLLVIPPFGLELYGIDASEDYVDGRQGWAVSQAGSVSAPTGIITSPDGTVMLHVNKINVNDFGSLYRSDDDGVTWTVVTPPSGALSCSAVDFAANGKVWALWYDEASADDDTQVYSSVDYGDTWVLVKTVADVGLGFTYPLWVGVDRVTGYVGFTRFIELGSGIKYFKGGVDGVSFPTADSSGIAVSGDVNGTTFSGELIFTQGKVTVASHLGTGGSQRLRLYNMAEDGSAFTLVYTKVTAGDISQWAQPCYIAEGQLFWGYVRASGGSGKEGLLRSLDAGATWEEIEVPSSFVVRGVVYDDQIDRLYIFSSGTTYYYIDDPVNMAATGAAWVSQTGPAAGFDLRNWQVTWVPK